jgi:beta-glucosidase
MNNWINNVDGIIDAWYPGQEGGNAIAEVLFGEYNPAGRLPITFPQHEGQLPLVYNHKPTGRGDDYNNLSGRPLFPFGFGLSYTTFEYSDIRIDKKSILPDENLNVKFTLKNTGRREGDEVVQLYIKDKLATVARPIMELKGFQRIHLQPDQSREITFTITPDLLKMLNKDVKRVVEPGVFQIMIGASSADIRLIAEISVVAK